MARLQIFKPGKHTATSGKVIEFTESMLSATADAYSPEKHEAPLVIGHPKGDAPAYGWVKDLAFADALLDAGPHQVDAQFAEMVNAGRFKKVSASFYEPDAPANPVPGVYYLRHVAFLGAQPPAVKGLKSASFADGEQGVVEFGDWGDSIVATLFRSVRDFFIEKFGKEATDKVLPDYSITALTERAAQESTMKSTSYSEPDMETAAQRADREQKEAKLKTDQEQLAKDRAELDRKAADFAERDKQVKAQEAAQRRAGLAGIIDKLIKDGKVLPAQKDGLVAFMAGVDEKAGTVEFGEGDKKVNKPAITWFTEYLAAQPKIVEFKEIGKEGVTVDLDDPKKIAEKAVEFQESEKKAGRVISISEAVQHITGAKQS